MPPGAVVELNPELGTIRVNWDTAATDREWYFGTGIHALWGLKAGNQHWSDALLAFTFDGTPQDLGPYLTDPYWSSRYAPTPGFSWIPFYEEVATRLLAFRDDRPALAATTGRAVPVGPNLGYLVTDQFADGNSGPIREIDPFTVMGTFNRGMTDENRRAVAQAIASMLGVSHPLPTDFDGIPILNNQKSWFISYSKNRLLQRRAGAVANAGRRSGVRRRSVAGAARRVRRRLQRRAARPRCEVEPVAGPVLGAASARS